MFLTTAGRAEGCGTPPGGQHLIQARPIDFDDASWGHYALDLAIAADDIPEDLHQILLDGYQAVRPLPPATKGPRPRC